MATEKPKRAVRSKKGTDQTDIFANAPKVNIQADYRFSDEEKQHLGMQLAGLTQKKEEIAAHKKDLMAQINAQSEQCAAEIKQVSNKLRSGFEVRATDALVIFRPKDRTKDLHDAATKVLIRSEPMLPSDYVQELPMDVPTSQKPGATAPATEAAPAGKKSRKKATTAPEPAGPGQTPFGDALKQAAAGVELPRVPVVLDAGFPADKSRGQFRKAAKKAGWPEACIDLLDDEAKKAADVIEDEPEAGNRVRELLATHITQASELGGE